MPTIERSIDGLRLLERPGPGAPVVFLHGIGSGASSFEALWPHLPGDWRLLAWNAPGYGGSAPLPQPWPEASDYADRLAVLFDRLDLGAVHLVGHSLGALMAAAFAARRPRRALWLTLLSCARGHGTPRGGPLSPAARDRIEELETLGPEAFAAKRASGLVFEPDENPEIVKKIEEVMGKISPSGYAQAARMLSSGRLLDDVAVLTMPVSVAVGADDRITPVEANRAVWDALPEPLRGDWEIVPGCGHALYQQRPEAAAAVIRRAVGRTGP